jgi:hypothetical protein
MSGNIIQFLQRVKILTTNIDKSPMRIGILTLFTTVILAMKQYES